MVKKCECPDDCMDNPNPAFMYLEEELIGMYHKPHECKCTHGLKLYERDGKKIYLCSCCNLTGDKEINE